MGLGVPPKPSPNVNASMKDPTRAVLLAAQYSSRMYLKEGIHQFTRDKYDMTI